MKVHLHESINSTDNANIEIPKTFHLTDAVVEFSDNGLFVVDTSGVILVWNRWLEDASGVPKPEALGVNLANLFPGAVSNRLNKAIESALQHGMTSVLSHRFNPHMLPLYRSIEESSNKELMFQMAVIRPVNIDSRHAMVHISDVTPAVSRDKLLRQTAAETRSRELHIRAILSSIADAVITTDKNELIDYLNPVAEKLTGWSQSEALGCSLEQVFFVVNGVTPSESLVLNKELGEQEEEPRNLLSEMVLYNRQGNEIAVEHSYAPIRNMHGDSIGNVLVFRDVTVARALSNEISWLAAHDPLTGLENRMSFEVHLEKAIYLARNEKTSHCLMYLDLDQFKIVNDTCGHIAGDKLLKEIASLINKFVRANDTLARLGGDEFGLLLLHCPLIYAKEIAHDIRRAVENFRFNLNNRSFSLGISIGIAAITPESSNMEDVLSAADTACYAAKESGRNNVKIFSVDQGEASRQRGEMQWVRRIQEALEENRFTLYIQPIVPINANCTSIKCEVLLRMIDEDGTVILPGAFIPAAERFNLMYKIDIWVVNYIFTFIRKYREKLVKQHIQFSVNLSGRTICNYDASWKIQQMHRDYDIPRGMINFEITETAAVENFCLAVKFIKSLKKCGCLFSLDDFGSGFSSFAYLKNLPVDFLKIDGAFVKNIANDPISYAMVESINQVGHVMGLKTIAEFVEDETVIDSLRQIGVDYAQGYGIALPRPLIDGDTKLLP